MTAGFRTLCAFLVAVVLGAGHVYAQAGATAQITGTVRDSSGGVLPGVDVTATQTQTNFSRSAITDENGIYTLPNLPIGPYRIQATLSGFRTYVQTGVVLTVNANPEIAIEMALGELSETVSVEAAAPLVETRSPSLGQVVDNERIEELPLNGRNATDLIALAPASVPQVGLNATSRSMQGGQAFAVAGGQAFGVAYLLDGATHNNPYDNLNLPLPFPDALQEFRLETSSTTANAGMHSGASVNAVTKSGTNLFHGDLFEFVRNHRFNATNPFNLRNAAGERQGDGLSRNQYGGTFSGPVISDRMFFFGAYQGTRIRETPADLFAFVPTAAMLAGDFTAYTSAACNGGTARTLTGVFAGSGNRIDPARLSPAALNIARRLPTSTDPCGRVNYSRSRPQDEHQYIGKVDVQLSQNHSLFGRYMMTTILWTPPLELQPDNLLVSSLGGRDNKAHSFTAGDTLVLSNSMVNAFRVAYNYTDIHRTHAPLGFDTTDVGIRTYSYLEDYMLLSVSSGGGGVAGAGGGGGFQLGGGTESEARFKTPSINFTDDLTIIRGDHQYGIGASVSWWKSLSQANVRSPGQFNFTGQATGLPLSDFLTGSLNQLIQATPNSLDMQQLYLGLYVQDTWKFSPKATLSYGLRWEPGLAQQIRNGAIYNFSAERFTQNVRTTQYANAPPGFLYPGDDGFVNDKAGMKDHWLQFSPRVGFAWDPAGDGRMSIRSGYSLAYDFVNAQFHLNTSVAPPFNAEARTPTNPVGGFDNPWLGTGNETFFPFTTGVNSPFPLTGPYIAMNPDIQMPRQQSWNVSFQRQIGDNLAASATYLGTYSDRLWNVRAINVPQFIAGACTLQTPTGLQTFNPCSTVATNDFRRVLTMQNYSVGRFLGVVDEHVAIADQKYNGLVLSLNRRSANGLTAGANYTLSKCTGLPTQGGTTPNVNSGYVNPADPEFDRGPCDSDRRHNFNFTASAQTPQFDGRALRWFLSDWRLSGILRAYSGQPFSVTVTTDPARTGIGGQRASVSGEAYGDGSIANFMNRAAFADPAVGAYGNSGRNAFNGPAQRFLDMSLVRSFRFANTHRIEARLESFNAFNWFTKNNPINVRNNPLFGSITTAQDPRIMQFAVKYQF
jgi:hypothetical protein